MAMPMNDLTSRDAVQETTKEYDDLGKEAFLKKYGYRSAKKYLLVIDNRRYDSKAIAGVAYGLQYREKGPLAHSEFSGGITRGAAASRLKALGFEILHIT